MALAMTTQQSKDFDEKGFVVLEEFLNQTEIDRLLQAIDEVGDRIRAEKGLGPDDPFAVRNALSHHEAFLDLIDHPRILPLVVDAIGWNIQVRTTHLDYRPPYPEDLKASITGVGKGEDHEAGYRNVGWHPDLASDDAVHGAFPRWTPPVHGDQGFLRALRHDRIQLRQSVVGAGQSPAQARRTAGKGEWGRSGGSGRAQVTHRFSRVVAHRGVALRRPEPVAKDAEDHARGIPLPLASSDRIRRAGSRSHR